MFKLPMLVVAFLAVGLGAYKYGARGPDLTLSVLEQYTLTHNEVMVRAAMNAPIEAGKQKEHDEMVRARTSSGVAYANALRKRHRCEACQIQLNDSWTFSLVAPTFEAPK